MKGKILIVEDDEEIVNILERWLNLEGYQVLSAADGISGVQIAAEQEFDLVILDLMLPGKTAWMYAGKSAGRRYAIRYPHPDADCQGQVPDRVSGLDSGADDYLTKPFDPDELLARIRALLRRTMKEGPRVYEFEGLTLDTGTHLASREGRVIELTAKEYELLSFSCRPNQVLTRSLIYDRVWAMILGGTAILSKFMSVICARRRRKKANPA